MNWEPRVWRDVCDWKIYDRHLPSAGQETCCDQRKHRQQVCHTNHLEVLTRVGHGTRQKHGRVQLWLVATVSAVPFPWCLWPFRHVHGLTRREHAGEPSSTQKGRRTDKRSISPLWVCRGWLKKQLLSLKWEQETRNINLVQCTMNGCLYVRVSVHMDI